MRDRATYRIEWVKGLEQEKRIYDFLMVTEKDFIPRLSGRVEIGAYAKKLSLYAETIFVSVNGTDIAACSLYCDTEVAYISSFAVRKEYGRCGVGTAMMKEVKLFCKRMKCEKIRLEVFGANRRAVSFYQKEGFEAAEYLQDSEIREYSLRVHE